MTSLTMFTVKDYETGVRRCPSCDSLTVTTPNSISRICMRGHETPKTPHIGLPIQYREALIARSWASLDETLFHHDEIPLP